MRRFRPRRWPASSPGTSSLYATHCASCHGTRGEGNATLNAPGLARLNDWYLVTSYDKYRGGLRGNAPAPAPAASMQALAQSLPAQFAIEDVALYLNGLQRIAGRSTP